MKIKISGKINGKEIGYDEKTREIFFKRNEKNSVWEKFTNKKIPIYYIEPISNYEVIEYATMLNENNDYQKKLNF